MSITRALMALAVVAPVLVIGGCGDTNVDLKKEPLVQIPPAKAPEDQPKDLRPRSGSSSGMNYDPSGVGPK